MTMGDELEPTIEEIDAFERDAVLADEDASTPELYPRMWNISAGFFYRAVPRAQFPAPPEYVTVPAAQMQRLETAGVVGVGVRRFHRAAASTRTGRAAARSVFFEFLELRHKVELHNLTGRVVACPLDEMNRPRASVEPRLRVPPTEAEVEQLFAGWREDLVTCRKFGPAARNYAVA